jgi:hypothetical protein
MFISEILKQANEDISKINLHASNNYLRKLMQCAYLPEYKIDLPEGEPPYKKLDTHEAQTSGVFWQIARKIDTFLRKDFVKVKKEIAFINALESLSNVDASILIHVKDQSLHKLYPNLTLDNLKKVKYFR